MARVLIVDDQKSVLLTLESLLNSKGHSVVSATSAYDALQLLGQQQFDLMITDAVMPGGKSGFELTRSLRATTEFAKLPIILLTGKREPADVQRAVDAGVNDYIIKPIDPAILLAKVSSILQQKGAHEKAFLECPIRSSATFQGEAEIISLSEIGMTFTSHFSIPLESRIKMHTTLFEEIGMQAPFLRVVSCASSPADSSLYFIGVHFMGLSEKEFQPIRLFINSKRRNAAA